jgi:hypothetical protein
MSAHVLDRELRHIAARCLCSNTLAAECSGGGLKLMVQNTHPEGGRVRSAD